MGVVEGVERRFPSASARGVDAFARTTRRRSPRGGDRHRALSRRRFDRAPSTPRAPPSPRQDHAFVRHVLRRRRLRSLARALDQDRASFPAPRSPRRPALCASMISASRRFFTSSGTSSASLRCAAVFRAQVGNMNVLFAPAASGREYLLVLLLRLPQNPAMKSLDSTTFGMSARARVASSTYASRVYPRRMRARTSCSRSARACAAAWRRCGAGDAPQHLVGEILWVGR